MAEKFKDPFTGTVKGVTPVGEVTGASGASLGGPTEKRRVLTPRERLSKRIRSGQTGTKQKKKERSSRPGVRETLRKAADR